MRPGHIRRYIEDCCRRMKVGERQTFEAHMFTEAYPHGYPFNEYRSTEEAFLQTKCGSAFGTWRVYVNPMKPEYTVSRHEESDTVHFVSSDRMWAYDRQPDGTYIQKSRI